METRGRECGQDLSGPVWGGKLDTQGRLVIWPRIVSHGTGVQLQAPRQYRLGNTMQPRAWQNGPTLPPQILLALKISEEVPA